MRKTGSFLETLEAHKAACAERRLAMIRPLPELAVIFRAIIGDPEAQAHVTIREVSMYEPGQTFSGFLEANHLPVFERELRGWPA